MIQISDGNIPQCMIEQNIDMIWNNLMEHLPPSKFASHRVFGSLFTALDINEYATIAM